MATTSTEEVSNSTHQTYRLGQNIINRAREKIWNGDIVATASTHGFWEPDKEFKVNELKRKFHQSRYLQVKHLPRDVSEEEIRQMLSDFPISSVVLSCGHGSAGSAKAYLEDPEMLEDWDKDRTFLLRGQKIPVSPTLTEFVLCVARYPLNYSESHFTGLVSSYGEVKMCFLMISEKTGESKGYGFVEYASKETALHAKSNLDGLLINDTALCADFIDSTHITFESLHSKCLYVDNLPHNYRDMGEFRRKFSKVVNPPYCQIALKNGCPQNWGLVEFSSGEDAENTLTQLNGCELKDKKLRISYYIPGVRAINLYLKLLNETDNNRGKGNGLLPTPPPGVFQSFKNLQKQNPLFAQSIQNIMVTEQQLGVGNMNSAANSQTTDDQSASNKPGAGQRKKPNPSSKSAPSCNVSSDSPAPDDQQAAFLRLLAGQNSAFLQTPQIVSFLKQPKGALNGAQVLVPGAIPSDTPTIIPTPIAPGVSALPVIPAMPDFSAAGLYSDVKPSAPVNLLGVNTPLDAMTAATFPSTTEAGVPLTMTAAGQPAVWNSTLNSAAILPEVGEKSIVKGEKNVLEQVSPLTQRPQRLAALVPPHSLARGVIPIATAIHPSTNPIVADPQTSANGFLAAWFSQPTVLESAQFSYSPSVLPAITADNGLASLISQNTLPQYLGDINSNLVTESLNQYMENIGSFSSKQNSYKLYNTQNTVGNESSKNSYSSNASSGSSSSISSNSGSSNNNNSSSSSSGGSSNNNNSKNIGNNKNSINYNSNNNISNNNNNNSNNNSNNNNNLNNHNHHHIQNNSNKNKNNNSNNNNSNSSNNNDIQPANKKMKIEWNGKGTPHSSPPLNNNLYRTNSTFTKNSDCTEPELRKGESPNPGHVPQSPVEPLSAPLWPAAVSAIPHSALGVNHALPRPIGFEARWLFSNANLRSTPTSYVSCPSSWNSNPYASPTPLNVTPVGQKRKYTRFLPSPEPSPEGNYIGQHSQGIGGHYLDSWPKRKKKN